jgi:leucyl-tRNA synthetase
LGLSYDWDREINTTDPKYYKWTQWIFEILFERGLAYQAEAAVNWCPALGTVLANEEVKDGKYVETGDPVERKTMKQWMLGSRLRERLSTTSTASTGKASRRAARVDWSAKAQCPVQVARSGQEFTITTRPDTLFGATSRAFAPEHALTLAIDAGTARCGQAYVGTSKNAATRPLKDEDQNRRLHAGPMRSIPSAKIDLDRRLCLADYGYGAIMAVPGHDTRDYEFATQFGLAIIEW